MGRKGKTIQEEWCCSRGVLLLVMCHLQSSTKQSWLQGLQARLYHTENTGHLHKCRGQGSSASSNLVFSPQEPRRLCKVQRGYFCAQKFKGTFSKILFLG